jgi:hypothetical protein
MSTTPSCRCQSYNRPDWGGDQPEVILPKPDWSSRERGICVDACIADAIKMLWFYGVITDGCCCGHNREAPSVIIDSVADAALAHRLLTENDGRKWTVMQWKLVTFTP